jgi:hypothetical protein
MLPRAGLEPAPPLRGWYRPPAWPCTARRAATYPAPSFGRGPGRTRTGGPRVANAVLSRAELRAHRVEAVPAPVMTPAGTVFAAGDFSTQGARPIPLRAVLGTWTWPVSNRLPLPCKGSALPGELQARVEHRRQVPPSSRRRRPGRSVPAHAYVTLVRGNLRLNFGVDGCASTVRGQLRTYPGWDSNPHCRGPEPRASCRWATWAWQGVLVFQVRTSAEDRPVAGADSCIMTVPDGVLLPSPSGEPAVNVRALGRVLRQTSEELAASIGEVLHHATWQITKDPQVVEEVGMHGRPDCGRCRAGVDQALAHLANNGAELLVGVLYWAG